MKSKLLITAVFIIISFLSISNCNQKDKDCQCENEFDGTITYYPGDYAWYADTCRHAHFQGRGVIPGSLTDDVWEICVD